MKHQYPSSNGFLAEEAVPSGIIFTMGILMCDWKFVDMRQMGIVKFSSITQVPKCVMGLESKTGI